MSEAATPGWIARELLARFGDVHPKASWGETAFFVNPDGKLPSGSYFVTLKEKDGENDRASNLDRDGIFRLNFGPGRKAFTDRYGAPPQRPGKGGIIEGPWDFSQTGRLMPHPVYGWMSWMCILNPSRKAFAEILPLIAAAHQRAIEFAMRKLERR